MNSLDELAIKNGTDKSSMIHDYCFKYEKYLTFNRNDKLKILEIGVWKGESLSTWSEFYPNSLIVGIDINKDCKIYESEKIKIEIGSQIDEQFLKYVVETYGEFDLIIDDGSHYQSHMIKSFEFLFPYVKKTGLYVVEDVCCSYWSNFEGGFRKSGTSVEYFKGIIDDVNFNGELLENFNPSYARKDDLLIEQVSKKNYDIRTDIESLNFMNSIIIITKR
jgi:hypothetical protein